MIRISQLVLSMILICPSAFAASGWTPVAGNKVASVRQAILNSVGGATFNECTLKDETLTDKKTKGWLNLPLYLDQSSLYRAQESSQPVLRAIIGRETESYYELLVTTDVSHARLVRLDIASYKTVTYNAGTIDEPNFVITHVVDFEFRCTVR